MRQKNRQTYTGQWDSVMKQAKALAEKTKILRFTFKLLIKHKPIISGL
jgi:hypothetical protein